MNNYLEGKFGSLDHTFCTNENCKMRKKCARNLKRYPKIKKPIAISMSRFECEEEK